MNKILTSCDKVVRIEIIDTLGKKHLFNSYKTTAHLSDMGLTLKLFINERPFKEAANA